MQTIKRLVASCAFLLILAMLIFCVTQLLKPTMGEYIQVSEFYQLPKNSLDFATIGSSHAYCTFDPVQLEKKSGLKSFTFSSAALSMPGRLCYLKEMYKTQNPKVIYMDATGVDLANEVFEKHRHENFTYLPVSINRYKYALESVRPNLWEEMIFPLKLYHSNWTNFSSLSVKQMLYKNPVEKKGYVTLTGSNPITFTEDDETAKVTIDHKKLKMYDEIVQIAEKHNTKLVFFSAPMSMGNQAAYMRLFQNRYKSYENVFCLNMSQWINGAGLKADEDFYDSNHLNATGVTKVTPFIAKHVESMMP